MATALRLVVIDPKLRLAQPGPEWRAAQTRKPNPALLQNRVNS